MARSPGEREASPRSKAQNCPELRRLLDVPRKDSQRLCFSLTAYKIGSCTEIGHWRTLSMRFVETPVLPLRFGDIWMMRPIGRCNGRCSYRAKVARGGRKAWRLLGISED